MNSEGHHLSKTFEVLAYQTTFVVANVIRVETRSIQSILVDGLEPILKNVEELGFFEEKDSLPPEVFNNTKKYRMKNLGGRVHMNIQACQQLSVTSLSTKKKRTFHPKKRIDNIVESFAFHEVFELFLKRGLDRSFG